jgi:hypothetical protein
MNVSSNLINLQKLVWELLAKSGKAPGSLIILSYTLYKNQVSAPFILAGIMPKFSQESG